MWEPNDAERRAAWEPYAELLTRVSVVPLREDEGLLPEALSARTPSSPPHGRYCANAAPRLPSPRRTVNKTSATWPLRCSNYGIRPLLAHRHPALEDWECRRPADRSRGAHENAWTRAGGLRSALEEARTLLTAYPDLLASACGVPNLPAPRARGSVQSSAVRCSRGRLTSGTTITQTVGSRPAGRLPVPRPPPHRAHPVDPQRRDPQGHHGAGWPVLRACRPDLPTLGP